MRTIIFSVVFAFCICLMFPAQAVAQENVFPALSAYEWQNKKTVDFDNLKYTGTHVILVFWSIINLDDNLDSDAGYVGGNAGNAIQMDSAESGLTDRGATNWIVSATDKYKDANIVVIGVIEKGTYSFGRSKNKGIDNIPHLRDRSHTIREKICKQANTCSFVVISPEGAVISGYNGIRFTNDKRYFGAFNGEAIKSTDFKGMDKDRRFTQIRENIRTGQIGAAMKMVKPYIGKDGTAKNDEAAKAHAILQKYQDSLKADVEALKADNPAEAHRLAEVGLMSLKGARSPIEPDLKNVIKELKSDKSVKQLGYQKKLFLSAAGLCTKGKADKSAPYFKKVVETDADSYYGKAAKLLLDTL